MLILFGLLPWVAWNQWFDRFELPKVIVFICVSNAYVASSWMIISKTYKFVNMTVIEWLGTALLVLMAISTVINCDFKTGIMGQYYRYQGWITLLAYWEIVWVISGFLKERILGALSKYIGWSGIMVSAGLVIEKLWQEGRVALTLGNPNFAGGFVALALAYLNNLWLSPIFLAGIWVSGSRSAMLAAGLIIWLKLMKRIESKQGKLLITLLVILNCAFLYPKRGISSYDKREIIWQRGLMAVGQKPILGWGLEGFERAFVSVLKDDDFDLKNIRVDKAHNEIIETAVNGGLVAVMVYLSVLGITINTLWRKRGSEWAWDNLLGLFGFVIISNLNVVNVNSYLFFYLAVGTANWFLRED